MLTLSAKRYYYDDQRIALQTSVPSGGSETDNKYFVFGNYIDEVLMMHRMTPETDFYYAHDHLYSPVAVFGPSGTVVERYEYDAYGKVTIWDAGFTTVRSVSSALVANPFAFTGRELDNFDMSAGVNPQLKLMYYRARYYDPQTGRFLQRDPLDYIDGYNLYEYVISNPIDGVDPTGQTYSTWFDLWNPPPLIWEYYWDDCGMGKWDCKYLDELSEKLKMYGECRKEILGLYFSVHGLFKETRNETTYGGEWPAFTGRYRKKYEKFYGIADVYIYTCECTSEGYPAWVGRKSKHNSEEKLFKTITTLQKKVFTKGYDQNNWPIVKPGGSWGIPLD